MEAERQLFCEKFTTDSTTSSITGGFGKIPPKKLLEEASPSCLSMTSSSTSSSIITPAYFNEPCVDHKPKRGKAPNISYELSIAKSALKQYSTLSGNNLFDHLSDIIKRVIDERPPNVIDFFEEFSRNVREQKFHQPERFPPDAVFVESRYYPIAKKMLASMKLPYPIELYPATENFEEVEDEKSISLEFKLDLEDNFKTFRILNQRVQQLQFYWNQCGFTIANDDIFQLACSMDRLQNHPSISQCRFWGFINGLKSSYYIVEALLTSTETNARIALNQEDLKLKNQIDLDALKAGPKNMFSNLIGPELYPGKFGWESWDKEELEKMKPDAAPIPIVKVPEIFDIPPETTGSGVYRFTYFVVNTLSDDWMELPIATPKQICISRMIKKFLTGDLESDVNGYPCFPGKEKHLLRAMIARITAGTFIAPRSYYRKLTKREKRLAEGNYLDDEEEEAEEEAEEEEEENEGEVDELTDNDILLVLNESYEPKPLEELVDPFNWVHVRPNILDQGRVVYFDVEKQRKLRDIELQRMLRMRLLEEMLEHENEEEENDEEHGEEEEEDLALDEFHEQGPAILTSIDNDIDNEGSKPWVSRFTSMYTNKLERVLVFQSNIWPGSYAFCFEKHSESIYMGWGNKYVARNMPFVHLRPIKEQYPHAQTDFQESQDPTVFEEEEYRQYMLLKEKKLEALKNFDFVIDEGLSEGENDGLAE